jgi:hypothetical protein
VKTGWFKTNLAEPSKERYGSKGAVLPVMMRRRRRRRRL